MGFVGRFFVIVLVLSYVEIILLVDVAAKFGFLTTLVICFLTAVIGGNLVRKEGFSVLSDLQRKIALGEDPSGTIVGGVLLFICGVLLLVPGFVTDVFGFLCLVKKFREGVGRYFFGKIKPHIHFTASGTGRGAGAPPRNSNPRAKVPEDVIDVDFTSKD